MAPFEDVKMHWEQTPDLDNTGMDDDINDFEPEWEARADDFMCTESGPITDAHIWLSFMGDILPPGGPGNLTLMLEIWTNIPADQNPMGFWSAPGTPICGWVFDPGTYNWRQVCDNNPEDWHAFFNFLWIDDDHLSAYQYDFLMPDEMCIQDSGTIYWLAVYDITPTPHDYKVGWKTTTRDLAFMDAACGLIDPPNIWVPVTYPAGHEYFGDSLDYAFVITGGTGYICGDTDSSGGVDIDDVVYLINYIFGGGPPPNPLAAGDVDCSGGVDIDDAVWLINFIFGGGNAPCDVDGDGIPDC